MMAVKTVGLASDHAGYALKQFVKEYLAEKGYAYKDFGTDSEASCDYADYAHPLARAVEDGECSWTNSSPRISRAVVIKNG